VASGVSGGVDACQQGHAQSFYRVESMYTMGGFTLNNKHAWHPAFPVALTHANRVMLKAFTIFIAVPYILGFVQGIYKGCMVSIIYFETISVCTMRTLTDSRRSGFLMVKS